MANPLELEIPRGLIDANDLTIEPELRRPDLEECLKDSLPRRRLSHLLVAMRNRLGYTQKEMAEALGVTPSRISRIEAATTPWPKAQTIERYSRLCGVSLGYAFFRWDRDEEGSIFPLDPKAYDGEETAEERKHLDAFLPAEVRREGVDQLWRETMPRRRLARHLIQMRNHKGLNQKEMAARLELHPSEVSRMESGLAPWPKAERLQLYAHSLGWDVGFAFLESDGGERQGWIIPLAEPVELEVRDEAPKRSADVPLAVGGLVQASAESEKVSFDVVLAAVGDKKIDVIKEVRAITGLGLKDSKDLVEAAPKPVKEDVGKDEAEEVKTKLEGAGATATTLSRTSRLNIANQILDVHGFLPQLIEQDRDEENEAVAES